MKRLRLLICTTGLLIGSMVTGHALAQSGTAELRLVPERQAAGVGETFEVRVEIARADAVWAGYSIQVAYDGEVLEVVSVEPGGIAGCEGDSWGNPENVPNVVTGCAFQTSTETGVAERITYRCKAPGTSELRFVTLAEDPARGSTLFDESAVNIETRLVNSRVTCGDAAAAPSPTPAVSGDARTQGATPTPTGVVRGAGERAGVVAEPSTRQAGGTPPSGQGTGRLETSARFVVPAIAVAALVIVGVALALRWPNRVRG